MDKNAELQQNLKLIYRSLPDRIKDVIVAPETTDVHDAIQKKYTLNDTQREALYMQCGFLLMGLRNPQELVTVLAQELSLPRDTALSIAQDLNREIFYGIKEELKSLYAPQVPQGEIPVAPTTDKQSETTPTSAPTPTTILKSVGEKGEATVTQSINSSAPQQSATALVANIFEEKLGGAFRVKSDTVQYTAPEKASLEPSVPRPNAPIAPPVLTQKSIIPPTPPTPVLTTTSLPKAVSPIPPAPRVVQQTPMMPPTPPSTAATKMSDPYRELQ